MEKQAGFSLLEVMVAAVILASGLAGLAALLLGSVRDTSGSGHRTAAAMLAENLAAQARLTPGALAAFSAAAGAGTPDCGAAGGCAPEEFARYNLRQWQAALGEQLPGGGGVVCRDSAAADGVPGAPRCDGAGGLVIKVFWREGAAGVGGWRVFTRDLEP